MPRGTHPNSLANLCDPFGSPYGPESGRPPIPEHLRKDVYRNIRMTADEDAKLRADAEALNITVSELVRDRALGRRHRSIDRMGMEESRKR
jgi:hypothetical protein